MAAHATAPTIPAFAESGHPGPCQLEVREPFFLIQVSEDGAYTDCKMFGQAGFECRILSNACSTASCCPNSSSSALASFRSAVSNPSVNQPYIQAFGEPDEARQQYFRLTY
jgi:hypothetical protein